MAWTDTLAAAGRCVASPYLCVTGGDASTIAGAAYDAGGGRPSAEVRAGAEQLAAAAGKSSSALLEDVADAGERLSGAASDPLERIEGTARWIGIGVIAVAVIIVAIAAIYFASPIIGALRAAQ